MPGSVRMRCVCGRLAIGLDSRLLPVPEPTETIPDQHHGIGKVGWRRHEDTGRNRNGRVQYTRSIRFPADIRLAVRIGTHTGAKRTPTLFSASQKGGIDQGCLAIQGWIDLYQEGLI